MEVQKYYKRLTYSTNRIYRTEKLQLQLLLQEHQIQNKDEIWNNMLTLKKNLKTSATKKKEILEDLWNDGRILFCSIHNKGPNGPNTGKDDDRLMRNKK
jgi:hypothetical protein